MRSYSLPSDRSTGISKFSMIMCVGWVGAIIPRHSIVCNNYDRYIDLRDVSNITDMLDSKTNEEVERKMRLQSHQCWLCGEQLAWGSVACDTRLPWLVTSVCSRYCRHVSWRLTEWQQLSSRKPVKKEYTCPMSGFHWIEAIMTWFWCSIQLDTVWFTVNVPVMMEEVQLWEVRGPRKLQASAYPREGLAQWLEKSTYHHCVNVVERSVLHNWYIEKNYQGLNSWGAMVEGKLSS